MYNVKGIVTITRQKYLTAIQNGPYANAYDQWRNDHLNNRYQGVQFGYEGNGRYQNWDEIWNETLYHEKDLLPGDYKYLDWNGDGEINSQDDMKKLIIFLATALLATSCVDMDVPPKNVVTADQLLSDESGIDIYMARMYSYMPYEDF